MRPIETVLLLANLLAFFVLAVPRLPRAVRPLRHLALIALPIAIAQVLVEGPRWQMAPAYALAGLFFVVWLVRYVAPAGLPARRRPPRPAAPAAAARSRRRPVGSSRRPSRRTRGTGWLARRSPARGRAGRVPPGAACRRSERYPRPDPIRRWTRRRDAPHPPAARQPRVARSWYRRTPAPRQGPWPWCS